MERVMPLSPAQLAESFHQTNARLAFLLDSLLPDVATYVATNVAPSAAPEPSRPLETSPTPPHKPTPRAATPQQMAALLSELMRAGQWLRSLPSEKDAELEQELSKYRKQVERLRALLPSIQQTLLGERARLERERAQVVSASEWANRSRLTL